MKKKDVDNTDKLICNWNGHLLEPEYEDSDNFSTVIGGVGGRYRCKRCGYIIAEFSTNIILGDT